MMIPAMLRPVDVKEAELAFRLQQMEAVLLVDGRMSCMDSHCMGRANWFNKARNREMWRKHAEVFVPQWTENG